MEERLISQKEKAPILVVDDDRATAYFIGEVLKRESYPVTIAGSFDEAVTTLQGSTRFSVVVSDVHLDNEDGTRLVAPARAANPKTQIIFMTGFANIDGAVKALHEGAFDYIGKSDNLLDMQQELIQTVGRAVQQSQQVDKKPKASDSEPMQARSMIGKSPQMVKIYHAVAKASMTSENVLIHGESGTGKELVAHAIHEKSPFASKPFVTVNCCALTETLLESELFGHIRGSFTGATQNKKGLFEVANGGTIFLDEIGDISPTMQVKLLRAIQEGEIKPVGAHESLKVDVRVIAATHRDLGKCVAEGKFREDLYYRLKVILIEMPALRDRPQDLPDLIEYFLNRAAKKAEKPIAAVSDEAMEMLLAYNWPGNIRELENAIGRATAMTSTSMLYPEDFPPEIAGQLGAQVAAPVEVAVAATATAPAVEAAAPAPDTSSSEVGQSLEDVERKHILKTLESVGYNKSRAAEILGIDRVTLYRRAFRYGLLNKRGSTQAMKDTA